MKLRLVNTDREYIKQERRRFERCEDRSHRGVPDLLRRLPAVAWVFAGEVVKAHVTAREHFGQHDDLSGMHRNGKRNLKRFPFFI